MVFLISFSHRLSLSRQRRDPDKLKNKDVIHLTFKEKDFGRKVDFPDQGEEIWEDN